MNKQGERKIDYLDYTWSPITGCLHGCKYCYMKRMAKRFPQISMKPAYHPERLLEPLKVKKPAIIGVSFSGDMWGNWVPPKWIDEVINICEKAHWHKFLFLTKNPVRYSVWNSIWNKEFKIPENCWCGTSVSCGYFADHHFENLRISQLLDSAPAGRRFLSLEPFICLTSTGADALIPSWLYKVDWVIVGGLTGKGAKRCDKNDLESIVENCRDAGVPLFIKNNAGYPKKIQEYPESLILND